MLVELGCYSCHIYANDRCKVFCGFYLWFSVEMVKRMLSYWDADVDFQKIDVGGLVKPSCLFVFCLQAKIRRAELQKARALQSYYEAKTRREKKIKSKKWVEKMLEFSVIGECYFIFYYIVHTHTHTKALYTLRFFLYLFSSLIGIHSWYQYKNNK